MTAAQISELVTAIVTLTGLAAAIWRQAVVIGRVIEQREQARKEASFQRARAEQLAVRKPGM